MFTCNISLYWSRWWMICLKSGSFVVSLVISLGLSSQISNAFLSVSVGSNLSIFIFIALDRISSTNESNYESGLCGRFMFILACSKQFGNMNTCWSSASFIILNEWQYWSMAGLTKIHRVSASWLSRVISQNFSEFSVCSLSICSF